MIDIRRDGTDVVVTATGSYESGPASFALRWNAGQEWSARLLCWSLQMSMGRALKAIREQAYRQGWRDAKAKRAKETWFSVSW